VRAFSDLDNPANATLHIVLSEYNAMYLNAEERRARLRRQLVDRVVARSVGNGMTRWLRLVSALAVDAGIG